VTAGILPSSENYTFNFAGDYWYQAVYSGDENNNGANSDCTTEPVSVETAPILAVDDNAGPLPAYTGQSDVVNVFDNDQLNGEPVVPALVTLTRLSGGSSVLTLNTNGSVDVAPGTAPGSYSFDYQICEVSNPSNCDTASVTVILRDPSVEIQKTAYAGHDGGASCPGTDLVNGLSGAQVTYCFIIDNTGDTILDITVLDDADLGINLTDVTFKSGDTNSDDFVDLDETWTYYFEGTITSDLTNTAEVTGNPVDDSGIDIPDLSSVTDTDSADVAMYTPSVDIQKTAYSGHDSGDSCPGVDLVNGLSGAVLTYCFAVDTSGDTSLDITALDDADLGIDLADITFKFGDTNDNGLLDADETWIYYYEGTITGDLTNTADVTGNPVDGAGIDLAGLSMVINSDTAEVGMYIPGIGVAKSAVVEKVAGLVGTWDVSFEILVRNYGNSTLTNLLVQDDLAATLSVNFTVQLTAMIST
jgi:hypothetical protein